MRLLVLLFSSACSSTALVPDGGEVTPFADDARSRVALTFQSASSAHVEARRELDAMALEPGVAALRHMGVLRAGRDFLYVQPWSKLFVTCTGPGVPEAACGAQFDVVANARGRAAAAHVGERLATGHGFSDQDALRTALAPAVGFAGSFVSIELRLDAADTSAYFVDEIGFEWLGEQRAFRNGYNPLFVRAGPWLSIEGSEGRISEHALDFDLARVILFMYKDALARLVAPAIVGFSDYYAAIDCAALEADLAADAATVGISVQAECIYLAASAARLPQELVPRATPEHFKLASLSPCPLTVVAGAVAGAASEATPCPVAVAYQRAPDSMTVDGMWWIASP